MFWKFLKNVPYTTYANHVSSGFLPIERSTPDNIGLCRAQNALAQQTEIKLPGTRVCMDARTVFREGVGRLVGGWRILANKTIALNPC
jgi:hypothetical protein